MTDQPDQPPTNHDQPTTDQPTTLPLAEAAAALGISPNAVRQRLKRGTLSGHKTADGWMVNVSPATATDQPTNPTVSRPTTTNHPAIDLQPLADVIERQSQEIRRLSEAAAVWQVRAMQAEEQLKQLTAGDIRPAVQSDQDAPVASPEAHHAAEPPAEGDSTWWERWRQWWLKR